MILFICIFCLSLSLFFFFWYACNAEGLGSIPGLRRFPGEGNDKPLQYSCLENPMDRGA